MSVLRFFYFWLWQPFCLTEQNHLCNFGKRHYGEHCCDILSLYQGFKEMWSNKSIFSSSDHFVQRSRTTSAILTESLMRNILHMKDG